MAFPLGVLAAVNKGTGIDRAAQIISVLGQSLPTFWVAIILVEFVAGRLQWLPAGGNEGLASYVLPGFTLGWFVVAGLMRLLRSGMLEVLDSEYVKLARVKGVVERRVVWMHALKNALIPVVTFAGIYFSILVTTAIVVETVFAWPGLGRLAYEGISSRDFPVIQAVVLTTAAIVAVVSLGVDSCTPSSTRASATPGEPAWPLTRPAPPLALPATPASPAAAARGRRLPLIPLGIITAFVVVAILAPLLEPGQSLRAVAPPSLHAAGLGRARQLGASPRHRPARARHAGSRIMCGARVSLAAGVVTVLLASGHRRRHRPRGRLLRRPRRRRRSCA